MLAAAARALATRLGTASQANASAAGLVFSLNLGRYPRFYSTSEGTGTGESGDENGAEPETGVQETLKELAEVPQSPSGGEATGAQDRQGRGRGNGGGRGGGDRGGPGGWRRVSREFPEGATILKIRRGSPTLSDRDIMHFLGPYRPTRIDAITDFRLVPSGDWFVHFDSPGPAEAVYKKLDNSSFGLKTLWLSAATPGHVDRATRYNRELIGAGGGHSVVLLGCPWTTDQDGVRRFLRGFESSIEDITMITNRSGAFSGRAVVRLANEEEAWRVVREKSGQKMERRPIRPTIVYGTSLWDGQGTKISPTDDEIRALVLAPDELRPSRPPPDAASSTTEQEPSSQTTM